MTTQLETQNLAVARQFVEQFLGKGDMSVAEVVLDENVQAITGLKPSGAIAGREEYKQIFMLLAPVLTPLILK